MLLENSKIVIKITNAYFKGYIKDLSDKNKNDDKT